MARIRWHIENEGLHIDKIIAIQPCLKHGAIIHEPCWTIDSLHGPLRAICDQRARATGATGKITPYKKASSSISKKEHN